MRSVQAGPSVGLATQGVLLAALAMTVGLGVPGWGIGLGYAIVANVALGRALVRRGMGGVGPGDRVTLARSVLVGGVCALVADSFDRAAPVIVIVSLAALALVLDAVDGQVARRTGTASSLGARFDMEVDAFLILVLSVYVAAAVGAWVLLIGLARYAFGAAGWFLPWLRAAAPARYWSKVVAAIQGVVLVAAVADILPRPLIQVALAVALALLVESFGRQIWWLWRCRNQNLGRVRFPAAALTVPAALVVWLALAAPNKPSQLTPAGFAVIPLAGIVVVAVALFLPPLGRRVLAPLFGVTLGLLLILKVLDLGFFTIFDRAFDVLNDWSTFGSGVGVLADSIGQDAAIAVTAAVTAAVLAVLVLIPVAVARLTRVAATNRRVSIPAIAALAVVWMLLAVTGVQSGSGVRVASTNTASLAYDRVHQLHHDILDRNVFAVQIAHDPLHNTPGNALLNGLRGKDVLLVFVESYGRVAVQDSSFSPGINEVLTQGTCTLQAAGFSSRSAFLTSPTFGGISWLAHSTMESGLWVDSQQRYNQLLTSDRLTLASAFARAGWSTVSDVPADTLPWPQGARFYHFETLYNATNVGYRGPRFGYATMPDQYTLSAFQRLVLSKPDRRPVMAEIDLVSSHAPWTPLPHLVPWNAVGDGSIFDPMPAQDQSPQKASQNTATVRTLYGQSIEYTLNTLFSFIATYPDPNLVMIVVGDHQPHTKVSGAKASHDVPISIVTHDPAVLNRVSEWNWDQGMLPGPSAPVWQMSAFRDRFLNAYSTALTMATDADAAAMPGQQCPR